MLKVCSYLDLKAPKKIPVSASHCPSHLARVKIKKGIEGILDPFATGLLIIATGYYTRYLSYFSSLTRVYQAKLILGELTDTLDSTGKIISKQENLPLLTESKIKKAMQNLTGKRKQIPPAFSNVKINGIPARKIARRISKDEKYKMPVLPPRDIEIISLHLISYDEKSITFLAEVGSGTYIRSLGLEMAESLGSTGHLSSLRRLKIGNFNADDICSNNSIFLNMPSSPLAPDKIKTDLKNIKIKKIDINNAFYWLDQIKLPMSAIYKLQYGQEIKEIKEIKHTRLTDHKKSSIVKVLDEIHDNFYGLAVFSQKEEQTLRPLKMLPIKAYK